MENQRIYKINSEALNFFRYNLKGEPLKYCKEVRKLSSKVIKDFQIGYAPNDFNYLINYLNKKGYTLNQMEEAGLVSKTKNGRYIDFFRNRIIFPIFDIHQNVIGFGGRVWEKDDNSPKYLNTVETPVFKKRTNLYGINRAKVAPNNCVIVCEGYMDCIALQSNEFYGAVAGLGTALTTEQCLLIKSLTDTVVLLYDGDSAGQQATEAAITEFEAVGISPKIAQMRWAKDADEFLKKYSKEKFQEIILDNAMSVTDYKLNLNLRKFGSEPEKIFEKNLNIAIKELLAM